MAAVKIRVAGAVQGVGFRPFCYREAVARGLAGYVLNDLGGVEIVLEGDGKEIEGFLDALRSSPPPASRITDIKVADVEAQGFADFRIVSSEAGAASQELEVSPDLATCDNCRREIADSGDRRHRYPFTNCTDCGPRYSIIRDLPYDRPKTTMSRFRMCALCQAEYENPGDRRFHVQPNACPRCGPEVVLFDNRARVVKCRDPLEETVRLILAGKIVAVKGLGGYHLMCDACNPETVRELRRRKRRPHKALALMCRDIVQARGFARISAEEEAALTSTAAPILLLGWNPALSREIRDVIAPLNPGVGIMLAYTPLHHLLFATGGDGKSLGPIVATSANRGDEPIIAREVELFARLADVFDAVLAGNRPIENRIDDSVGFTNPRFVKPGFIDPSSKKPGFAESGSTHPGDSSVESDQGEAADWMKRFCLVRRARGFAPAPISTPFRFPPALAVGAEMKGSFAICDGARMWLSPHIGELTNRETIGFFAQTLLTYLNWFRVEPRVVACDLHPDYLSTRWAEKFAAGRDVALLKVQHHHAHITAVLFEHHIEEDVLGLALDGTGYGPDGSIWGCELLRVTDRGGRYERLGHMRPLPLVGGEAAIRRPRRMAAGVVASLFGADKAGQMFGEVGKVVANQLQSGVGVIHASSAGRLFDAAAGLLGLVDEISFEAQAPIALESLCRMDDTESGGYPFSVGIDLDPEPALAGMIADLEKGVSREVIATRFHVGLADALMTWVARAARESGIHTVAVSGGVFANRSLMRLLARRAGNLTLHFPRLIPASDGGIAAGQLLVVASLTD